MLLVLNFPIIEVFPPFLPICIVVAVTVPMFNTLVRESINVVLMLFALSVPITEVLLYVLPICINEVFAFAVPMYKDVLRESIN